MAIIKKRVMGVVFFYTLGISSYTIAMTKKLAIVAALTNPSVPAFSGPEYASESTPESVPTYLLNESLSTHLQLINARILHIYIQEYESGTKEKFLVETSDRVYQDIYGWYVESTAQLQQKHHEFKIEYPKFQSNLQEFFDQVCCDRTVMDYVNKSVICCADSRCYNNECIDKREWPFALRICDELRAAPCKSILPVLVPENMTLSYRFSNTAPLSIVEFDNESLAVEQEPLLSGPALNQSLFMYLLIDEAVWLNDVIKKYKTGDYEQWLVQQRASNIYRLFHKLYINDTANLKRRFQLFDAIRSEFQQKLPAYFDQVCCNKTVMDYVKKVMQCCKDGTCSPEECYVEECCLQPDCRRTQKCYTDKLVNIWYAAQNCEKEFLSNYACNSTLPALVPANMKQARRFNDTAPLTY